jgi:hypothetical protein
VPRDPGGRPHFLALGGLEGVTEARPLAHCFVASKAAWHEVTDSVHCFDDAPPGYEVPVVPERTRPHAEGGRAAGSCLCGRVTYEIESEGATFRHCHCSRCRRARGAVHASNMLLQIPRFRWTGGAEMVEDYRLPEAERFAQAFCRACGSAVPRVNQELGYVVVPAGGLDDDPGIRPKEHIFVGSKAPWYEISDMLPQHREYAPQ